MGSFILANLNLASVFWCNETKAKSWMIQSFILPVAMAQVSQPAAAMALVLQMAAT